MLSDMMFFLKRGQKQTMTMTDFQKKALFNKLFTSTPYDQFDLMMLIDECETLVAGHKIPHGNVEILCSNLVFYAQHYSISLYAVVDQAKMIATQVTEFH